MVTAASLEKMDLIPFAAFACRCTSVACCWDSRNDSALLRRRFFRAFVAFHLTKRK